MKELYAQLFMVCMYVRAYVDKIIINFNWYQNYFYFQLWSDSDEDIA